MTVKHEAQRCEWCNKVFYPKNFGQKFCDRKCYFAKASESKNRLERECPQCHVKFLTYSPTQKYCSRECWKKATIENRKRICPACNKEFDKKRRNSLYCSRECSAKGTATTKRKYETVIPRKDGKIHDPYEFLRTMNEHLRANGGKYIKRGVEKNENSD